MPEVVSFDEVKARRRRVDRGADLPGWYTDLIIPSDETGPQAFFVESPPGRVLPSHFHAVDQFEVFIYGGGTAGRHQVMPLGVHFARSHTPCGPWINNENGIGYITLRPKSDTGTWNLPESREALMKIPNRASWQVLAHRDTRQVEYDGNGAAVRAMPSMRDGHGLSGQYFWLLPGKTMTAPDPANTGGQYFVVTKGTLIYRGKPLDAVVLGFVSPEEKPFVLTAGPDGIEGVILSFPRRHGAARKTDVSNTRDKAKGFRTWQCVLCSFVYDEAAGIPEEGIAPGTRWEDVPDTFGCPDCAAAKADFAMIEV